VAQPLLDRLRYLAAQVADIRYEIQTIIKQLEPQGDTSLSATTTLKLNRRTVAALLLPKLGPEAIWVDSRTAQQAMAMAAESDSWGH
jgi:hypothetical protein